VTLRFGLVGAGGIARTYVDVFDGLDGAHIVGVADSDQGAAHRLGGLLGVRTAGSCEELLRVVELDAALIQRLAVQQRATGAVLELVGGGDGDELRPVAPGR